MAENAKFISSGTRRGNGTGAGDGWGGPAKGSSTAAPRSNVTSLIPGQPSKKRAISAIRRHTAAEIAEELRGTILHIARHGEREETRLAAACKLLDRIEGLPVARTINAEDDAVARMSEDELRAEIERLRLRQARVAGLLPEPARIELPADPVAAARVYQRLMQGG